MRIPLLLLTLLVSLPAVARQPNVLFIIVDDLRPQFGAYGKSFMHTPALDRFAREGTVFTNAYVSVPVCGASRASLFTGLRARRGRFTEAETRIDEDAPGAITLPLHFRRQGYTTIGLGKIYHHLDDNPDSWTVPAWRPGSDPSAPWQNYLLKESREIAASTGKRGPAYEAADVPDSAYYDGQIAQRAIRELNQLAESRKPFFLAVGFLKPHLPFNAPERYWDLYTPGEIRLATNPLLPENAPRQAWHNYGELRNYSNIPASPDPVPDSLARKLVHGYYAAVSYTDAQIGRVLDELDRLGLAGNTIVVLVGDHGWSLGEHGLWCKHSPFDVAVHAPLIIRAPGLKAGQRVSALAEFVDLYPTLVEMAGIPRPDHLAGASLSPWLREPSVPSRPAVYPRWKNSESIRTERYLYTEWYGKDGKPAARMLYDLELDPAETVNRSEDPAYASTVTELSRRLRAHVARVEHE